MGEDRTEQIVRELGALAGAVRDWWSDPRPPDTPCPVCRARSGERDPGVLLEAAREWIAIMTRPSAPERAPIEPIPIDEGD